MIAKYTTLIAFLGVASGICTAQTATDTQAKPNVLFIVCDDLNTHVSPSGYDAVATPNLESLSREGMTFNRAFCQYPVCGPSRASLLSGLYPESTRVLDNKQDIRETRPGTVTIPQYFRENGYWTAGVGKVFHNLKADHGELAWSTPAQWFDNDELPVVTRARKTFEAAHGSIDAPGNRKAWKEIVKTAAGPLISQDTPVGHGPSGLTDEQHKDGKNARQIITWLKEQSYGEKPFFIALGIQKPHVPFLAPQKYFDMYPQDEIAFHRDDPNLWNSLPPSAKSGRFKDFGFELGKEKPTLRREYMQAYHACVSFLDAQIGLVLQELKNQGLWDNTIIVLTSDHGYHLGEHFMWGKVTLFDIGAKVPFIVRAPGLTTAGSRSDTMVELLDVFPTLTELAGLEQPKELQGASLVPVLKDPSRQGDKAYAYSVVTRGNKLGYAIRNQKWRYGKWPDGEELYDLIADPHERNNLANINTYEKRLVEFRDVLAKRQKEAGVACRQ